MKLDEATPPRDGLTQVDLLKKYSTLFDTKRIIQESGFEWPKISASKKTLNPGSHVIFPLQHSRIWKFAGVFIGAVTFQINLSALSLGGQYTLTTMMERLKIYKHRRQ